MVFTFKHSTLLSKFCQEAIVANAVCKASSTRAAISVHRHGIVCRVGASSVVIARVTCAFVHIDAASTFQPLCTGNAAFGDNTLGAVNIDELVLAYSIRKPSFTRAFVGIH
jgi:hypothetical protein